MNAPERMCPCGRRAIDGTRTLAARHFERCSLCRREMRQRRQRRVLPALAQQRRTRADAEALLGTYVGLLAAVNSLLAQMHALPATARRELLDKEIATAVHESQAARERVLDAMMGA